MELMHRHYSCAPQYTLPARSPGSTSLFTPSLTTHTRIVLPSSSPLTHTHTPRTAPNLSFLPPPLPPLSQRPGKQMTRKEIMDMIWEVDEDLDDMISWSEFEAMYVRRKRARERERERHTETERLSDVYIERDVVCVYILHCCLQYTRNTFLIEPYTPPPPNPHTFLRHSSPPSLLTLSPGSHATSSTGRGSKCSNYTTLRSSCCTTKSVTARSTWTRPCQCCTRGTSVYPPPVVVMYSLHRSSSFLRWGTDVRSMSALKIWS